jgi:hypothetical protein
MDTQVAHLQALTFLDYQQILIIFALALIILRVVQLTISYFFDPLRDIPGPWLARWTRLWYQRELWGLKPEKSGLELHKRFGTYT